MQELLAPERRRLMMTEYWQKISSGFIQVNREYLEDLEWLKEAAEELLDEHLAGELGKPCRVLLKEGAVCRDECYTDCAARRLQTVLRKLETMQGRNKP